MTIQPQNARLDSWVRMRVRAFVRVCMRTFAASSASSSSEASSPKRSRSCSCNPKRPLPSRRTRNEDACYMLSPFRYREHSLTVLTTFRHHPPCTQNPLLRSFVRWLRPPSKSHRPLPCHRRLWSPLHALWPRRPPVQPLPPPRSHRQPRACVCAPAAQNRSRIEISDRILESIMAAGSIKSEHYKRTSCAVSATASSSSASCGGAAT